MEEGNTKNLISGSNKQPKWDEAGGHVLNFHGRVTQSSIKTSSWSVKQRGIRLSCSLGAWTSINLQWT